MTQTREERNAKKRALYAKQKLENPEKLRSMRAKYKATPEARAKARACYAKRKLDPTFRASQKAARERYCLAHPDWKEIARARHLACPEKRRLKKKSKEKIRLRHI